MVTVKGNSQMGLWVPFSIHFLLGLMQPIPLNMLCLGDMRLARSMRVLPSIHNLKSFRGFHKWWYPKSSIFFLRIFPYKSSILGYPHLWGSQGSPASLWPQGRQGLAARARAYGPAGEGGGAGTVAAIWCNASIPSWNTEQLNGNPRIPKWRYCTFFRPYFGGVSPYIAIGFIYGRYLQFRFLKWPLNNGFNWKKVNLFS